MNSIMPGWIHAALEALFRRDTYTALCDGSLQGEASTPSSSSSATMTQPTEDLREIAHTVHPSAPRVQVLRMRTLPGSVALEVSDTKNKLMAVVPVRE